MIDQVIIRPIDRTDCQPIVDAFVAQGWKDKPIKLYLAYLEMQEKGERDILIAKYKDEFAGYLTIAWKSGFQGFKDLGIPEIVDFNVLKKFQRKGFGSRLMDEAERRIKRVSKKAGIAFGAIKDYGPAQILYIKRGYIPWGNGVTIKGRSLDYGDKVVVGDDLVFHLSKELE